MVVDLPTPGEPVMPTRIALPVSRQQGLHQIARGGLMVAAPALDQRDGARQRRAVAGTEVLGDGLDVQRGILRQGHALLYNGEGSEARGRGYSAASLCPSRAFNLWISSSAASAITVPGGKIASAPAL